MESVIKLGDFVVLHEDCTENNIGTEILIVYSIQKSEKTHGKIYGLQMCDYDSTSFTEDTLFWYKEEELRKANYDDFLYVMEYTEIELDYGVVIDFLTQGNEKKPQFDLYDILTYKSGDLLEVLGTHVVTSCDSKGCSADTFYTVIRLKDNVVLEVSEQDCRLKAKVDSADYDTIRKEAENDCTIDGVLDHYNALCDLYQLTRDAAYREKADALLTALAMGVSAIHLSDYYVHAKEERKDEKGDN